MDYRFGRIQSHLEGCLLEAGVFERSIDGGQLFDVEIIHRSNAKWLVVAAGVSVAESQAFFSDEHKRERSIVPIQVSPSGQASLLLIMRPEVEESSLIPGRFVTKFSADIGFVELRQGCYIRIDDLENPAVRQVRWELDPVIGFQPPLDQWLLPWAKVVECNPAHAPSHWHVNSPPLEVAGPRRRKRTVTPPELRLAVGLPNPLLLLLSLANWLRQPMV